MGKEKGLQPRFVVIDQRMAWWLEIGDNWSKGTPTAELCLSWRVEVAMAQSNIGDLTNERSVLIPQHCQEKLRIDYIVELLTCKRQLSVIEILTCGRRRQSCW